MPNAGFRSEIRSGYEPVEKPKDSTHAILSAEWTKGVSGFPSRVDGGSVLCLACGVLY